MAEESVYEKASIKPYYQPSQLDVDFIKNFKAFQATSLDMLDKICSVKDKVVGFDTETTGLVFFEDKIVGCSISFTGDSGFYVPLRHENEDGTPASFNLPIKESIDIIYNKLFKNNTILLYNSCFDLTMIGQELWQIGLPFNDIETVKFLDVLLLVYLLEPEIKKNGLKWAARHFLGRIAPTFEQITGISKKSKNQKHFGQCSLVDEVEIKPTFIELKGAKKKLTDADIQHNEDMQVIGTYYSSPLKYACYDSGSTYALWEKLMPVVEKMWAKHKAHSDEPFALETDCRLARAMLHYKHTPISFNAKLMKEDLDRVEKELEETQARIFEVAGEVFNINSTQQKRQIFQKLGIDTGVKTKTGMSVSKDAIKNIDHPITTLLNKYSSLNKSITAYFEPLSKDMIGRINIKTTSLSTGRLSSGRSGSESDNNYYSSISVQTLPKPKNRMYEAVFVGLDSNDPDAILGYKFHPVTDGYMEGNPDKTYIEGFDQNTNVRNCLCGPHHIYVDAPDGKTYDFGYDTLLAEKFLRTKNVPKSCMRCELSDDWCIVSTDFGAEELAVIANLSQEPSFVKPLLDGVDLHRCYSDDTEFLTNNGFKKYDDIDNTDLLAQYDNGVLTYVKPLDKYEGYSDTMVHIKNRYTDLLVTPNHRMLCRTSPANSWKVKEAGDLVNHNYIIPSEVVYKGTERKEPFTFKSTTIRGRTYNKDVSFDANTFIEFLGFFLGDGHAGIHAIDGGNSYRINVSQSYNKYAEYVIDLNKRMGNFFAVRENKKENSITLEASHISLCKWLVDNFVVGKNHKKIPNWVYELSLEQRELFLQAFIKADGTIPGRNRNLRMLYAHKKSLIEDLMRLSCLNGYRVNLYPHPDKVYMSINNTYAEPCYCLGIHKRKHTTVDKKASTIVEEKHRVVCFSVPSSFLVVRRNDKISISGNSMAALMFAEKGFDKMSKADQKNYRKKAKAGNFGLAYRGSYKALLREIPDEQEAMEVYEKWWANMAIYKQWQQERIDEMMMYNDGDATNLYGRMRRFKPMLSTGNISDINAAIRAACNHYIQSVGGDLMRIIMSKFYEDYLKFNKSFNEIRYVASIHDEIAFAVRKDCLSKWVYRICDCMESAIPKDWLVRLKAVPGISPAGKAMGQLFDFEFDRDDNGKIIEGTLHLKV